MVLCCLALFIVSQLFNHVHVGGAVCHGVLCTVHQPLQVLRAAVRQFGVGNWAKAATLVPGRTQAQVRERWVNHLDENIVKGEWSPEEDEKLKQICGRYTGMDRRGGGGGGGRGHVVFFCVLLALPYPGPSSHLLALFLSCSP